MAITPYDKIADWYDAWVGANALEQDPFFPSAEALIGPITGQRVCDLACGQGRVARRLAELGARVVGVDISARLLRIGRLHERHEPRGITYLRADAQGLAAVADDTLDGVVCFQALMDIPDLAPTLRGVGRILRPGGWFVFAILHPCYHTARSGPLEMGGQTVRIVGEYFREGHWRSDDRPGPPGKVGAYHRTLSTYVNALTDAGLTIDRMSEPRFTGKLAEARPIWAEVPAVLIVRCRKAASALELLMPHEGRNNE